VSIFMWLFLAFIGLCVYGAISGFRSGLRSARNPNASNDRRDRVRKLNQQRINAEANRQAAERIRRM
jgi:hypothetical protein